MKKLLLSSALAVVLSLCHVPQTGAQVVGDILGIYAAPSTFDLGTPGSGTTLNSLIQADAVGFVIENTSGSAITNGVFNIGGTGGSPAADTFNVPTIAAGSYFSIVPGISDDGGAGHTFFLVTGSALDTSDDVYTSVNNGDGIPFFFTGIENGQSVSTGIFTPADTRRLSNDGVNVTNFIGGQDPCSDCFGPAVIGTLSLPQANVPEPTAMALLTSLVMAVGAFLLSLVRSRQSA